MKFALVCSPPFFYCLTIDEFERADVRTRGKSSVTRSCQQDALLCALALISKKNHTALYNCENDGATKMSSLAGDDVLVSFGNGHADTKLKRQVEFNI